MTPRWVLTGPEVLTGRWTAVPIARFDRRRAEAAIALGPDLPHAACKHIKQPLWDVYVYGESAPERCARLARGAEICRGCPQRAECLAARLNEPELGDGLWGGELFSKGRQRILGRRGRRRGKVVLTKVCAECGQTFTTAQSRQRFCRSACRETFKSRAKATRDREQRQQRRLQEAQAQLAGELAAG